MKNLKSKLALFSGGILMACSLSQFAQAEMSITSSDIKAGEHMPKAQEFQGFGCAGDNLSPHLSWSNAPKDTKSFAVTAYDPDAPTGSGLVALGFSKYPSICHDLSNRRWQS